MNKEIRVFISSTYIDLREHRAALIDALNKIGMGINTMEYFCSLPDTPLNTCLNELANATLYIGIIGSMYGSVHESTGKSYTQLEYEKAKELGIPTLIFIMDESRQPILSKYIDKDDKYEKNNEFKTLLKAENTISYFTTSDDLVVKVLESIIKNVYSDSDNKNLFSIKKDNLRTSWQSYRGLFSINNFNIAYIPLINEPRMAIKKLKYDDVLISTESIRYKLPSEFEDMHVNVCDDSNCCRLSSYHLDNMKLYVTFSETSYIDYLKSGEHLDDPYKNDRNKTLRDGYGNLLQNNNVNLRIFNLTNICGCGIFVITRDNIILATKHPSASQIYPSRLTYSSSGTMKFGAYPHPFTEVLIKSRGELNHQIDMKKLYMIGFGADARKLYFEFSFLEKANIMYKDIASQCETIEFSPIPFELNPIIASLFYDCWEPAAEATLITMALMKFGYKEVEDTLMSYSKDFGKRELRDEWDYRASNGGYISTLSIRYPSNMVKEISDNYEKAVISFIKSDVEKKRILEVGSGDGRFTKYLVDICKDVVCIDLCEKMNKKNKEQFSKIPDNVSFITEFAQNYYSEKSFDVVVISLVLIHNVLQEDFENLIHNICKFAGLIFVFEDVSHNRKTSPYTKIRNVEDIIKEFKKNDFELECQKMHHSYNDNVMFFKFVRE